VKWLVLPSIVVLASFVAMPCVTLQVFGQTSTLPGCTMTECEERISATVVGCNNFIFASTFKDKPYTACPFVSFTYVRNGTTLTANIINSSTTIWADIGSVVAFPNVLMDSSGLTYTANGTTQFSLKGANGTTHFTITGENVVPSLTYKYVGFSLGQDIITNLFCRTSPVEMLRNWAVEIFPGSLFWDNGETLDINQRSYIMFTDYSMNATGPGYSFGIGCDPNEPATSLVISSVESKSVLITTYVPSSSPTTATANNTTTKVYGIFYFGSYGIPAETDFNKTAIERSSYFTNYTAFLSASAPAVYINSTSQYAEWSLPHSTYDQSIYFTNTPTHTSTSIVVTQGEGPLGIPEWFWGILAVAGVGAALFYVYEKRRGL